MNRGYPETLIKNLLSEIKFTERDTVPTLSVYYKGSLNEKMESYTRPTSIVCIYVIK